MKAKPKYDIAHGWKKLLLIPKKGDTLLSERGWKPQEASHCCHHHMKAFFCALWNSAVPTYNDIPLTWQGDTHTECRMPELRCVFGPESRTWPFHKRGWNLSGNYSQHTDTRTLGPKRTSGCSDLASCTTDAAGFYATLIKLNHLIRQRKDILLCPENTKKSRTHHFLQQFVPVVDFPHCWNKHFASSTFCLV